MRGLSVVAASGGHSSSRCAGLSLSRPLLLRSTGSRRAGSIVVAHGASCSAACGIFPDQGSNPCPLHWQADSQPLRHQGSPGHSFKNFWALKIKSSACSTHRPSLVQSPTTPDHFPSFFMWILACGSLSLSPTPSCHHSWVYTPCIWLLSSLTSSPPIVSSSTLSQILKMA